MANKGKRVADTKKANKPKKQSKAEGSKPKSNTGTKGKSSKSGGTREKNSKRATNAKNSKEQKVQDPKLKEIQEQEIKLQEIQEQKHTEKVLKEVNQEIISIKSSKKIPKKDINAISRKVMPNMLIAVVILFFLNLFVFGYTNVKEATYTIDLKVFSIMAVFLVIFVIEMAYEKDKTRWVIYSVESLLLAFFVLSLTYIYKSQIFPYREYVLVVSLAFVVYYGIKSLILFTLEVKKHKKSSSDIQKILK